MSITQDGNSFVWDGTVSITNATDISSGVCTLMLTPKGGVGKLPVLAKGDPGPPPVFDNVNVTTLAAGSQGSGSVSLVSAGGAGIASHYNLNLSLPQGAKGESDSSTISTATDLKTSPSSSTDDYAIVWDNDDSKFDLKPQLCGAVYNAISFTAASGSTSPQILASVTVPAQKFDWTPTVSGQAIPLGTANTHIDLQCLLNNASSGQQVGYGSGVTGSGSGSWPAFPVRLGPAFNGALSQGYGKVAAGAAATFYFQAVQTAYTSDSWSVPVAGMYFQVKVDPIPGSN